jgi:signal peptidase II
MILFGLVASVFVLDQITKYVVYTNMRYNQSIQVLGDFFMLTYTRNTGGAFSILSNVNPNFRVPFFIITSTVTIILILIFYKKIIAKGRMYQVSFGLILGGALGNLLDRVRCGSIVDFFDFGIKNIRWPVFNIADSSVCIGVGILFLLMMKDK